MPRECCTLPSIQVHKVLPMLITTFFSRLIEVIRSCSDSYQKVLMDIEGLSPKPEIGSHNFGIVWQDAQGIGVCVLI